MAGNELPGRPPLSTQSWVRSHSGSQTGGASGAQLTVLEGESLVSEREWCVCVCGIGSSGHSGDVLNLEI